ncbi:hypothetical protein LTSEMON_5803 [Salmonella enterica subsp. enterica serovar Montevideo str. S5-403]|uniref:Uncharacterized protein n=1 Tax=Salmonella enterica subsp. enterica serovar Montevideo str. S5-403 TaxID=913242 RepID=G5QB91_SALMO|nr:hypothetical protein LTSEMON_5803 [Salmonella enterica subsp. enterica serovar Montevideo str. S5-403]
MKGTAVVKQCETLLAPLVKQCETLLAKKVTSHQPDFSGCNRKGWLI